MSVLIQTTLKIDDQAVKDLLCCALEGGSNYWCEIMEYGNPDKITCEFKHLDLPLSQKGYVIIKDEEGDKHKLDRCAIEQGLQIMANKYPRHFANFQEDNSDAETGDVFLQCCVLHEIVYG